MIDGRLARVQNVRQEQMADQRETEWIAGALRGDQAAMRLLYARHGRVVTAYFARCGFGGADCDDLLQEVFIRAFRSLTTFEGSRGGFRTWLAAIARNVARKRWQQRPVGLAFDPEIAQEVLTIEDNPGHTLQQQEELAALSDCVSHLPPDLAKLVQLRYADARTTRGIAEAAGLAEATVRLRLQQAMEMLENCMKSKGHKISE